VRISFPYRMLPCLISMSPYQDVFNEDPAQDGPPEYNFGEMPNLCPSVNWEVRSTASRSISPRLTSHVTQDPASDAVSSTEQSSTLPEYSSVVDWDVRMTVESQWFSFELVFSFRLW
jgi:hypothetical protein